MGEAIQKGELSGRFNKPAAGKKLYHGIPSVPEGHEIRTSLGYSTEIPKRVRDALGISQTEKVPLVFASGHLSKALVFSMNYADAEVFMNMGIEGTDAELAIVCNRDITMQKKRSGAIYFFSASGFVDLVEGGATRQLVSDKPVPLHRTEKVMDIKSTDDLMRGGLQIFSLKDTYEAFCKSPLFDRIEKRDIPLAEVLSALISEGHVVWENHARGINPHPVLAERLNIQLPSSKLAGFKP